MTKQLIPFLFSLLISINSNSQDTIIHYYNSKGKETKERKANIIRLIINDTSNITLIDFSSKKDTLQFLELKTLDPLVENGTAKYFDESKMIASGHYNYGNLDSTWKIFRPEINQFETIDYSGIDEIFSIEGDPYSKSPTYFIVEKMPEFDTIDKNEKKRLLKDEIRSTLSRMNNIQDKNSDIFIEQRNNYTSLQNQLISIDKQHFSNYIYSNLYYPERAKRRNIQGRVYIQAVIDQNGSLIEPKVLNKVDQDLAYEAIRLILNSPKWKPGIQRGKKVRVVMTFQIAFIKRE